MFGEREKDPKFARLHAVETRGNLTAVNCQRSWTLGAPSSRCPERRRAEREAALLAKPPFRVETAEEQPKAFARTDRPRHAEGFAADLLVTLLLGIAAAATAWCAYEAQLWTSTQTVEEQTWIQKSRDATEAQLQGNQRHELDVAQFAAYLQARANAHDKLERFLYAHFSATAKPAVDAWLATRPFESADAPEGPFTMPQYQIPEWIDAARLRRDSAVHLNASQHANAIADDYMFGVVLLAAVSLFSGLAPKLGARRTRRTIVAIAACLLAGSLLWVFTRPVEVRRPPSTVHPSEHAAHADGSAPRDGQHCRREVKRAGGIRT